MNANHEKITPPDLDQLAGRLADHDGTDAAQPDSTLKELKAELDTLAEQVGQPAPADSYGSESALQRGLEFVKEFGHELSGTGTTEIHTRHAQQEDLGTIREYKLLAKLGEGGMGAVYKALHTKLDKVVALKILPANRLESEAAVVRFEREMKAVGKLEHPNIVAARDAGEIDGTHYRVMELVDGLDLSTLVRRLGPAISPALSTASPRHQPGEESVIEKRETPPANAEGSPTTADSPMTEGSPTMTVADACEMIRQAATGLQEAHEDGMVHRDIKPSNLMLARSRKGRKPPVVKILDMGLALLDNRLGEQRDLTSTGQMMGTLDYMAPEQGLDSHVVDIRADIYSLGATLHKLLTGQAPFPSDRYNTPVKLMMALATEQVPSLATVHDDLPAELVVIVDRMLARNPDDRFAEPKDVAEALTPFCEGFDLTLLLKNATAEDVESAEDESAVATHESYKSSSVETAPTIDVQSSPEPVSPGRESGDAVESPECATGTSSTEQARGGVAGVEQREPPAAFPSTATTARKPGGSLRSPPATRTSSWYTNRRNQILIAAALAGIVLLSAIIFYIKTSHGTIVVEIDDPSISVTVNGEDILISDPTDSVDPSSDTHKQAGQPIKLRPGEHTLHITYGKVEFDTDKFKLRRGEEVVLSVRLVKDEVQVFQKYDEQTVIGSKRLAAANYALSYDGASYVDISNVPLPDSTKPFTVEAKILSRRSERGAVVTASNRMGLTWNDVDAGFDWWFGVVSGQKQIEAHCSSELATASPVHIAGVWTGSQAG